MARSLTFGDRERVCEVGPKHADMYLFPLLLVPPFRGLLRGLVFILIQMPIVTDMTGSADKRRRLASSAKDTTRSCSAKRAC